MAERDLGAVLRRARRALERPDPSADALLLARFVRDRDESAFAELVERHGPAVWAACRRGTATGGDAEDVFQATFLVLARRADRVRKSASVGSWLYGTAVRLAQKARTRSLRSPDPHRLTQPSDAPGPPATAAWREVLAALDEELARLPDRLRAPLVCCYFDGLTQDEAAARLGWKVRTVKARVARGRHLLRARLARRGVDLSAALAAAALAKEGLSAPPAGAVLALSRAAPGYASRGPVADTVSVTAQALAREGLLMTRRKLAPILLTAGAIVLAVVGAGYVVGQAPKSPPPPGPGPVAPAPAAPVVAAKTDLAGDPLPPGAVARLGTIRYRVPGNNTLCLLLPDGDRALVVPGDGTVTYLDVDTGRPVESFRDPDLLGAGRALSPAADRLFLAGEVRSPKGEMVPTRRLYDLKARKTVWTAQSDGPNEYVSRVRFTPDGRQLIAKLGDELRVWDAATGAEVRRQKVPGQHYFDLSPDGKTVAVGYFDLLLWNWEAGGAPRTVKTGLRVSYSDLQFGPDGKTVYVFPHGRAPAKGFDVATGRPAEPLNLGSRYGWFSFSPDGRTVATGFSGVPSSAETDVSIVLLEVGTGKELRKLDVGRAETGGVQWSRDGICAAAVTENRLRVWDVKAGKQLGPDLPGHDGGISMIAFAADGRVYTAGRDPTVRAWDPATGREVRVFGTGAEPVSGLTVSADGSLVAGSGKEQIRVWDAKTGRELLKLIGPGRLRFSADDQTLLSFGRGDYLRAFDSLTGKLRSERRFLRKQFAGLDEEARAHRESFGLEPRAVDFGPDGKTLGLSEGKDVTVYSTDTGKERFALAADVSRVERVALSTDGRRLAAVGPVGDPETSEEYQVTVWSMADATRVSRFRVPMKTFWKELAFTADGRRVVTASWETVLRFWDAKTGEPVGMLDLPHRPECVAFSPDGKRVAVGFLDTTALVYDLAAALKPAKKE